MQFNAPRNYKLVHEALTRAGRTDLIGYGRDCLIPPVPWDKRQAGGSRTMADGRGKGRRGTPKALNRSRKDGQKPEGSGAFRDEALGWGKTRGSAPSIDAKPIAAQRQTQGLTRLPQADGTIINNENAAYSARRFLSISAAQFDRKKKLNAFLFRFCAEEHEALSALELLFRNIAYPMNKKPFLRGAIVEFKFQRGYNKNIKGGLKDDYSK